MAAGRSIDDAVLADLEDFYRQAKQRFDADPAFADRARDYVVRLQSGDAAAAGACGSASSTSRWRTAERDLPPARASRLTHADIRGESAYNDDLPAVVADLDSAACSPRARAHACVFLPEFMARTASRCR